MLTVTDYTKTAETVTGYTLSFDLSGLLASTVTRVEAQASSIGKIYQSISKVEPETISSYLNYTNAAIAFSVSDDMVVVFFNKSFLPYSGNTQFNIEGLRLAQSVTALSENCDVPDGDKDLLENYLLEQAYQSFNYHVPQNVKMDIQKGERAIARES